MTIAAMSLIHQDDVKARDVEAGDIRFTRRKLGPPAGCANLGLSHYVVPAGARQMPVHLHGDEEEAFYVLSGRGLSWQDGEACEVAAGDVVIHPTGGVNHRTPGRTHTFLAAEDEPLELLAFSTGTETRLTLLPRINAMWAGPHWVPTDIKNPFLAEAEAGPLERPAPTERPGNVTNIDDLEPRERPGMTIRAAGDAAGAIKAGLNHVTLDPGSSGLRFHCHTEEEEVYVILAGSGRLRLGADDQKLRAGHILARPPATGIAHQLIAGDDGLTYLSYGTRAPGDLVLFPDEAKVWIRGLGVTLDLNST